MAKPKPLRVWFLDEEPVEVRVPPLVQIQAEKEFNSPIYKLDRLEHLFWMAWTSLTRSGKETRDFETFCELVLDIEPVEAADSVNPTAEAQSSDS